MGAPRALMPVAAAALGAAALWFGTDGLRAYTDEAARRIDIVEGRRAVPDAALVDQSGAPLRLGELRGQVLVVDFVYTRCPGLCQSFGSTFGALQRALRVPIEAGEVLLLSVSFDPGHDGPAQLDGYLRRFAGERGGWRAAVPADADALAAVLRTFGITVIPDEFGGWTHNDAVHVVDRAGVIAAVLDSGDLAGIHAAVEAAL